MTKKKKKGRPKKAKREKVKFAFVDYCIPIFLLLHKALRENGYNIETPHPLRKSFWQVVPPNTYSQYDARSILEQYYKVVERELEKTLSTHSIAYWLHIYRRLSPGPVGIQKDPQTIALVRRTLEASIQKYATSYSCDGIGFSNKISEKAILNGMLLAPEFKPLRDRLKQRSQLVLTNFGLSQLIEFYETEKLAYEIWRIGATMRIVGKGADIVVSDDYVVQKDDSHVGVQYYYDARSYELDRLVKIYDKRPMGLHGFGVSATGTVYNEWAEEGIFLLPIYNVNEIPSNTFQEIFAFYNLKITLVGNDSTNFLWIPFNLKEYFNAHKYFSESFQGLYGLPFVWIIAVIGSLCLRIIDLWRVTNGIEIIRYWQRAYEGPYERATIPIMISEFLPYAIQYLDLPIDAKEVDISTTIQFLELNDYKRKIIDPLLGNPLSIFLPLNKDRFFIDYAWIREILEDLFFNVKLPDQNFKGEALEELIHGGRSVLPTGPCHSLGSGNKQIDAAFEMDDILVIVECRATGRSFAFERGDFEAISFRNRLINKALQDIDEKGKWLASNPVGSNYDIRKFKKILPIAITPFVEYIPSLEDFYWLNEELPRIPTPNEFKIELEKGTFKDVAMKSRNTINVPQQ